MRKSLELAGDGDDLDLIHDVEQVFGTWVQEADWENVRTVGDIEAALLRNMQGQDLKQDRCMTAMAFYDLRRNLGATIDAPMSESKLRPETPLSTLNRKPSQIASSLKAKAALSARFHAGIFGNIASLCTLLSIPVFFLGLLFDLPHLKIAAIGMFGSSFFLSWIDRGSFGPLKTIGDLAREIAGQNFAHYAARGGRFTRDDVWKRLQTIAADVAGFSADDIARDTLVLHAKA
ncbi:MAG: hypothetical protein KTR19_07490 [Hyphomicrobiales bacterium]|nr:hypothetical protein [Hyphomicrobiales bacterium]